LIQPLRRFLERRFRLQKSMDSFDLSNSIDNWTEMQVES
jgi:hypothetical protein